MNGQRARKLRRLQKATALLDGHAETLRDENVLHVHVLDEERVGICSETKCYGVDDEGDVLMRPPCGHLTGAPLETLKQMRSLANESGKRAMLTLRCPTCKMETLMDICPILEALGE